MAEIVIPSDTRRADAAMVGNPLPLQPFSFEETAARYPVSTPAPRYTVPIDEAIATNELLGRMKARDVSTQGQLLSQQIAQQKLDYQNNVQKQTEAALQANVLGRLVPGSPNFEAEKAAIIKEYPLAAQDPGFTSLFHPLDQQHNIQRQSDEVLKNRGVERIAEDARRDEDYRSHMGQQLRSEAAKYGDAVLQQFDKVAKDTNDPLKAFSQVSDSIAKARAQTLEDKPLTPQQVQQAISRKRADAQAILRTAQATNPNDLTGDLLEDYNALRGEIRELQGNPSNTSAPQSAPQPQYKEGQRATNPKTGESLIFRGGKWESVK